MVNCWFGAQWFGFLATLGVPRFESQTTKPYQQLTISWTCQLSRIFFPQRPNNLFVLQLRTGCANGDQCNFCHLKHPKRPWSQDGIVRKSKNRITRNDLLVAYYPYELIIMFPFLGLQFCGLLAGWQAMPKWRHLKAIDDLEQNGRLVIHITKKQPFKRAEFWPLNGG